MIGTIARPASVNALFSTQRADGMFKALDTVTVPVRAQLANRVCDVYGALAEYLRETSAPAGIYGFEFGGQFRKDRWNGTEFPGCDCQGGVDPECGMFTCWGIPADRQKISSK